MSQSLGMTPECHNLSRPTMTVSTEHSFRLRDSADRRTRARETPVCLSIRHSGIRYSWLWNHLAMKEKDRLWLQRRWTAKHVEQTSTPKVQEYPCPSLPWAAVPKQGSTCTTISPTTAEPDLRCCEGANYQHGVLTSMGWTSLPQVAHFHYQGIHLFPTTNRLIMLIMLIPGTKPSPQGRDQFVFPHGNRPREDGISLSPRGCSPHATPASNETTTPPIPSPCFGTLLEPQRECCVTLPSTEFCERIKVSGSPWASREMTELNT